MTWTTTEWDAFCGLLDEAWPGDFDDDTAATWKALLSQVVPQAAVEALKRLLLEGRRFRPSVSELLAEVRADPSQPTFEEMLMLVYRAAARDERIAWLAERSSLVSAFVRLQGPERLFTLQLDDPQWGEQRRRELREAWTNFLQTADRREVAAIASGRDLRQLDPLASLQIGAGDAAR